MAILDDPSSNAFKDSMKRRGGGGKGRGRSRKELPRGKHSSAALE